MNALDAADGSETSAVDVLALCGGSKNDLPLQSPELAARFTVVDSIDTHARIPEHFAAVDAAARAGGRTAIIPAGWDPGLFSLNRMFGQALPERGGVRSSSTVWCWATIPSSPPACWWPLPGAAHRMQQAGSFGAKTVFDAPPGLLSPHSAGQLRAELL